MSDEEIIRGFLSGDARTFSLIRGWIGDVLRSQRRGDDIPCEDIEGDTLLKLLEILRAERFRHESSLKTFVQKIARFTFIDQVRTRKRAREYVQFASKHQDHSEDPHVQMDKEESLVLFSRIMNLIDEPCRELWEMIFREGLSYAEIAKRTGSTEGAIKTRVVRCKQKAIEIREKIT